jgi:hypothetical protein
MKSLEEMIHCEVNMIRVDLGEMEDHIDMLRRRLHLLEEWLLDQNDKSHVNKNFELKRKLNA